MWKDLNHKYKPPCLGSIRFLCLIFWCNIDIFYFRYSLIWFVKSTAEPPTTPWRRARRSVWYSRDSRDSREDSRDSREDSGYSREALTRYCSQGSYCSAVSKWHFILRNWCQILMWASLMMLLATDPEIRFLKADCCSNWTDKHTVETKHVSSECDIQCWWTST